MSPKGFNIPHGHEKPSEGDQPASDSKLLASKQIILAAVHIKYGEISRKTR